MKTTLTSTTLQITTSFRLDEPVTITPRAWPTRTVDLIGGSIFWRQDATTGDWTWSLVVSSDTLSHLVCAGDGRHGENDEPQLADLFADLIRDTDPRLAAERAVQAARDAHPAYSPVRISGSVKPHHGSPTSFNARTPADRA